MPTEQSIEINRILFQYDLFPVRVEIREPIVKVNTANGSYALKRKQLSEDQIGHLKTAYSLAHRLVFDAVCPLPSKYGDLIITGEDTCYYILPWVEETVPESDTVERYRRLFVKAGQMHRQTMQAESSADALFKTALQVVTARKMEWEQFLNRAEHHIYPSPFEQIVLNSAGSYLGSLEQAAAYFSKGPENDENGKGKGLRRALCHGRLSPLHLLIAGERSCLTNFEECRDDFFIIETAMMVEQANMILPADGQLWDGLLRSYIDVCPLTDQETAFLFHFLLCPRVPADLMGRYTSEHSEDELWFIRRWTDFSKAQGNLLHCFQLYLKEKKEKESSDQEKEAESESP
ncbi:spore coat protein YsxE [Sporolactobacillus pectinivorans]|uniref:spore coat protein YsxE n=1 Tax=Sporolactobacillus pectinivorans TaxID=1591408 RepID=UPI001EFEB0E9|nr:spore coat protein YsxE [Sporolactobacillus pectinivorans]